jgi:hypothetical protein
MRIPYAFLLLLIVLDGCVNDTAQVPLTCSSNNQVSWSKSVKPLFETKCAISGCHVANSSQQLGLGTYEQVRASQGDVRAQVSDKKMPRGSPLSEREIFLITCWIDQGAKDN